MKKNLADMIRKSTAKLTETESTQSRSQTQADIQQLEADIVKLRANVQNNDEKQQLEQKVAELTARLVATGGEREIPIELIDLDPQQPRTIFPKRLIQKRAESLRRNGQQTPIVVRPQPNGRYVLFEGALRRLAAPLAGKTTLQSVFLPNYERQEEATIFEGQFTTSDDSEKLHDLDFANGLIKIIIYRYPYLGERKDEIPQVLNKAIHHLKVIGKVKELAQIQIADEASQRQWIEALEFKEQEQKDIITVLLHRQLNPSSINSNIFPILKLPEDLKAVIQETGLEGSKAKELAKLNAAVLNVDEETATQIRVQAAYQVVSEERSLLSTRELVQQIASKYNPPQSQINSKLEKTRKQIQGIKFEGISTTEEIKEIKKMLRDKIKELDTVSLFSSDNPSF